MTSLAGPDDLGRIEDGLKQLRTAYEKYFAGVERLEPSKEREQLKKNLARLAGDNSKNTARRFRVQSLQASFITHEQHWNRITRQIEEGTFKRDRLRAERLMREHSADAAGVRAIEADLASWDDADAYFGDGPVATPAPPGAEAVAALGGFLKLPGTAPAPAKPPAAATPAARPSAPPSAVTPAARPPVSPAPLARPAATASSVSTPAARPAASAPAATTARPAVSDSVRKLHEAYVQARRSVGEKEPVAIDAFAATVQRQVTAIKSRYKCEQVEFKVAVKDGKAILKAVPK